MFGVRACSGSSRALSGFWAEASLAGCSRQVFGKRPSRPRNHLPAGQAQRQYSSVPDFVSRYWSARGNKDKVLAINPSLALGGASLARPNSASPSHVNTPKTLVGAKVCDDALELDFGAGAQKEYISLLWLRDVCPCPACVDPYSGQKNFSTISLPDSPKVQRASVDESGSLAVAWEADPNANHITQPHTSSWSASTVEEWIRSNGISSPHVVPAQRNPWDRSVYEHLLPECVVSFSNWQSRGAEFWAAFSMLVRTGLVFITDVPRSEESVALVAQAIGEIQHTFYGRTWDVRSKPKAENVAYTSVFLDLHHDLMYHAEVPKLQFLHCLDNSCDGGESMFSDGLRAALELQLTRPDLYDTLREPVLAFHYNKGGHHYHRYRYTIEEDSGRIDSVAWAPPFQGHFDRPLLERGPDGALRPKKGTSHGPSIAQWKEAATAFEKLLSTPENQIQFRMNPGDCVIFDNTRVLHGRRQFNTATGSRWLKGTYVSNQNYQATMNGIPQEFLSLKPNLEVNRAECAEAEAAQVVRMLAL
jgi:gamma-butyrobetaine dioxygenase